MRKIILTIIIFTSFFGIGQKYEEAVYTVSGLAIKGYDPVAYFTNGDATKGLNKFSYEWKGAKWLFSTADNLKKFKANPEKYAPNYGGYCAWGMSNGYKAKVDPENAWTIHDGKLYLNYNKSIKNKWLPKKEVLIEKANKNWENFKE